VTRKHSPPAIAKAWGIDPAKVVGWIRSGELPAVNAATKPNGRPRWLVDETDLHAFELARRSTPPTPAIRHRRRTAADDGEIKFY